MYTKAEFEADTEYLEAQRTGLRRLFILCAKGMCPEGFAPIDGLEYKKIDDQLLRELDGCTAKLRGAAFSRSQQFKQVKSEFGRGRWRTVDPDTWQQLKQHGFKTRKIEAGKSVKCEVWD